MHANHFGDGLGAAAFLDYSLSWVHGCARCDNHNAIVKKNLRSSQWRDFAKTAKLGDMDVEWIREGLQKPGKTQRGLAERLGIDPAAVTRILNGGRQIKASEVGPIAAYLEVGAPAGFQEPAPRFQAPGGPDRMPVLGMAEGGEEGWNLWNGDVVDYVPRPPFLVGVPNAYAVYVTGESMAPRYLPGELLYVHPGRPPAPGDFVLVQAHPKHDGDPPRAVVKRLVRRTAQKLVLEQYNPAKPFEIATREVKSIHKILGSGE